MMIKRNYFLYAEVNMPNGSITKSWRQFYWRSFFSQPAKAILGKEMELANAFNVDVSNVSIKAFNRC